MASSGQVVLSYGDSLVRESDMEILKQHMWLNDVIIGFYFEYLSTTLKSIDYGVALYHPGLSQLLKMNCDDGEEMAGLLGEPPVDLVKYAMWAVNDSSDIVSGVSGSHWSLLVFSRPDNKFFHYDSWGGANDREARLLFRNLNPYFSPTSEYQLVEKCIPQSNGRDCGLHVIKNAKIILEFIIEQTKTESKPPELSSSGFVTATPEQANSLREQLIALITKLGASSS